MCRGDYANFNTVCIMKSIYLTQSTFCDSIFTSYIILNGFRHGIH